MVSTSGTQLLPSNAVRALRESLLPVTTILTPNIAEAKLLLEDAGMPVKNPQSIEEIINMAKMIQALGPRYVLVKGGHLPLTKARLVPSDDAERQIVIDVLYGDEQTVVVETKFVNSKNTHGTGCSLACRF